ncbi:hypothetical protein MIB92_05460 [Aestuariirhabdus sp. Z084]|uniref:hypothetical protein n=1 Tax=Aestuariirhabdus haliotis TaxID=2918751 RepID=UPI00201B3DDA|nr:hypothetical protein [Aestuariirhabdus haliotis]MCL6415089.1 hypothetical protein [Aestuariirhabdus haliotis]MCL6419021.1 hypothetical protein [Aestuariirhabdus haliotis]
MTQFTVQAINSSANDFYFYMFQKSPELEQAGFVSTAWLTTAYKISANGGVANFTWSINYGLQWSQQSTVAPGTIVGQGALPTTVSTAAGADNYVDFVVANQVPKFTNLQNNGSAGSLFINTVGANPQIPSDTFVFGLSVNQKLAWATAAQNGLLLTMTPNVKFWLTSGTTIAQNEVLTASVTSGAAEFDFKDGKNNAQITLGSNNTWSAPEYSATPYFGNSETTGLQAAPTAHGFSSRYQSPTLQFSGSEGSNPCDSLMAASHYDLTKSLLKLTESENRLMDKCVYQGQGSNSLAVSSGDEYRKSKGVTFDSASNCMDVQNPFIRGTITVGAALGAAFMFMVASNIKLRITRVTATGIIDFDYNGERSRDAIANAFAAGREIRFTNSDE